MRPPHTQIIIFHNEPPFHSCIYYSAIGDEYQKFKLITSSSHSDLSISYYIINHPNFQLFSLISRPCPDPCPAGHPPGYNLLPYRQSRVLSQIRRHCFRLLIRHSPHNRKTRQFHRARNSPACFPATMRRGCLCPAHPEHT